MFQQIKIQMIEQSILYALAVNMLFMLPAYKSETKRNPNYIKNPKYVKEVIPMIESVEEYNARMRRRESTPEWLSRPAMFNRKPFNCIYCMTFWVALLGACFIPLITGHSPAWFVPVTSPVIAVLVNRFIDSLPVKI